MNSQDWELLKAALEKTSLKLMKHECKSFAKTSLDLSHYHEFVITKRTFYAVPTRVFDAIIDEVLIEATKKFPEKFGTKKTADVLDALYQLDPVVERDKFSDFLRTEQFCYVFEIADGVVNDRILRIDLFRRDDISEFTGGVFHAFQHYSFDQVPLSTGKEINDLLPRHIIHLLTKAFYIDKGENVSDTGYNVLSELNSKYDLLFAFYFEKEIGVYFVKTIFKKSK